MSRVFRYITLEVGLITGFALILASCSGGLYALWEWRQLNYGELHASQTMRVFIPVVTAGILGSQTVLASFYFSILGLKRK